MEPINLIIIGLLIILIILNILMCYIVFRNRDNKEIKEESNKEPEPKKTIEDVIKILPKNLVVIYYIEGCSWCDKMKNMVKELDLKDTKKEIVEVYFERNGNYKLSDNISQNNKNIVDKLVKNTLTLVTTFPTIIKKTDYKIGCFDETKDLKEFINTQ
jgi:glutaredoxin